MAIERFIWTTHAEDKRAKRLLDRSTLEHRRSTLEAP
jgi:hypothetical protein